MDQPVTFRRSSRAKAAPLVVVLSVAVSLAFRPLIGPVAVVAFYLLLTGALNYRFQLEIGRDLLRMRGYVGGPRDIDKSSVNACRYHGYRVQGRTVELFFLEVLGLPGGSLKVWRYGWGGQRRRLFSMLAEWLAGAQLELGDRERAFLRAAAR